MADVTRTVGCPSCSREIRLTEAELLDKRGFCAVCDARFELVPEMFLGEGPNRSLQVVGARLPMVPPTGRIQTLQGDDGRAIIQIDTSRPFPIMPLAFSVFWFGALAMFISTALGSPNPLVIFAPILHVVVGLLVVRNAIKDLRGRDRIALGPNGLEIERRGALLTSKDVVPYDDLVQFRVEKQPASRLNMGGLLREVTEERVVLVRKGAEPIFIADGLGHGGAAAGWLAERLEQAGREGRKRDK